MRYFLFGLIQYNYGINVVLMFQERLAHLKRQCQPHVTEAAKSSVEGICSKMYNMAYEAVKKIQEKQSEILKENNIQGL